MTKKERDILTLNSATEAEAVFRKDILEQFKNCPIPDDEILKHLGLFINRQTLSRMLFFHDLYQKIIDVNGVIMEFGVRWGQNLALFSSFRGMYEPYNYSRKIIGFDTFSGFPSVHAKDGNADIMTEQAYSVSAGYEDYLEKIMDYHQLESPLSHINKYQLVKGDASLTIEAYLEENPETIIALAYFDFDLYEPTKRCLEAIKGHLTKGSILGFDDLNWHDFPGETLALKEVLGLSTFKLVRSPLNPYPSYLVYE